MNTKEQIFKKPNLYCRIVHRRWILWNNYYEPSHCGKCCNDDNWVNVNTSPERRLKSDKEWLTHYLECNMMIHALCFILFSKFKKIMKL